MHKKKKKEKKIIKYIYPSIIFGLMMTGFNYVFLIFSLYSSCYTGIYIELFNNVLINVIFNTIFDFILFGGFFLIDIYLILEVIFSYDK